MATNMTALLEILDPYTPFLALFLRVLFGATIVLHGYPKITGGWRQAEKWMTSMGVPASTVLPVTALEFFGGVFLIAGALVPLVALFFVIQFGSIIVMKRWKMGAKLVSMDPSKPSYEIDLLYLLLASALLVLGAGALSLDGAVGL